MLPSTAQGALLPNCSLSMQKTMSHTVCYTAGCRARLECSFVHPRRGGPAAVSVDLVSRHAAEQLHGSAGQHGAGEGPRRQHGRAECRGVQHSLQCAVLPQQLLQPKPRALVTTDSKASGQGVLINRLHAQGSALCSVCITAAQDRPPDSYSARSHDHDSVCTADTDLEMRR